jgi:peptide/nickel transport system permease protein
LISLVVRRIAQTLPMILAVVTIGFVLVHAAPGDPAIALSGEFANEGVQRALRETFGLDRSWSVQYFLYWRHFLAGDLGTSYFFRAPVSQVILERLPATLLLVLPSIAASTIFGVFIGARLARLGPPSRRKRLLSAIVASNAMPAFWVAQILLLVLSVRLGWFPVQGMVDSRADARGLGALADVGWHLVLPLSAMTFHQMALIVILTWSGVHQELFREYARAEHGVGLLPKTVRRHALLSALAPIVTAVGSRVGGILSGAVLTETVFAWPGLGRLAVLAATSRDYPLVLGLFLFSALSVLAANLAADLIVVALDPRIRT